MKNRIHYVYKITRTDGEYYIGIHSTSNLNDGYFGSGKILRRSIVKHGQSAHIKTILEYLPDRKSLAARELELVNNECLQDPLCMNIRLGGDGGWDHVIKDTEHQSRAGKIGGASRSEKKMESIAQTGKKYGGLGFLHYAQNSTFEERQARARKNAENRIANGTSSKGRVMVHTDQDQRTISPADLDKFLAMGYVKGRRPGVKRGPYSVRSV